MNFTRPIALATMALCALPAFAKDAAPTESSFAPSTHVRPHARFQMTDDQKSKLSTLKNQYILDTATKKAELKVAKNQLREELGKTSIDKSAAQTLQSKISSLKGDLASSRLNMMIAAADVFTPEQREAFKKMRDFRHGHGGHGKSFGGKMGPRACG